MRIGVIGVNTKCSELHLREQLARAIDRAFGETSLLGKELSCVVLSTCNRSEIYFCAQDLSEAHSRLLEALREEVGLPFEHALYSYFGRDAFTHLAAVATGLDSVVVGETEIQRQVKTSYECATLHRTLSSSIHFLFQKALKIGKELRSCYSLAGGYCLERAIFDLAKLFFPAFPHMRTFFFGNSEINRKILGDLQKKGASDIVLCTRTVAAVEPLDNVQIIGWDKMATWTDAALIICGTNHHTGFLLSPHHVANSPNSSPRLILDLGMPRLADPHLAAHPHITLINIEQLGDRITLQQQANLSQIAQMQEEILAQVEQQIAIFHRKESRSCAISYVFS